MSPIELTIVDAFTERPFAGNPAAVTILERPLGDDLMQRIASEMNLSETAFCRPRADGDYDLRWFSPTDEVDLCGHATLATAHVLGGDVRFHTRSGVLECRRGASGRIEMDLPANPPEAAPVPSALAGLRIEYFGSAGFFELAIVPDATIVRNYRPDLGALVQVVAGALIVSGPGDRPGTDCCCRVFGPSVGIPEDPVTGSAACVLACYWGERLGRSALVSEQCSARGGIVTMRRAGERVAVGGHAVTVARTEILVV